MKNIYYLLFIGFLTLFSCESEDLIFSETSEERMQEFWNDCNDILLGSTYGWKVVYFPKTGTYGGYNFLFNFQELGRVDMVCDLVAEKDNYSYSLNLSQGVTLSFDSYSPIHLLSDPQYIETGKGLQGDFEFVIETVNEDTINAIGKKRNTQFQLVKATPEDWEIFNIIQELAEDFNFNEYVSFDMYVGGSVTEDVIIRLNDFTHVCNIEYYEDEKKQVISVPYVITSTHCRFSKKIEIKGIEFDGLTIDSSNKKFFYSNDSNKSIKFEKFINAPLGLTPEEIPTYIPDPTIDVIKIFRESYKIYVVVDMSDDLKELTNQLKEDLPLFENFRVTLDRNSSNPGAFTIHVKEVDGDKFYWYGFDLFTRLDGTLEKVLFEKSADSKANNGYTSGWSGRTPYTAHESVVSMRKDFFFDIEGHTMIYDFKDTYWIRSNKNPNSWWKLVAL